MISISATQISLFNECERKYGFSYILKIRQPETPAQALGLSVEQDEITPYLLHGRPFSSTPAGVIARTATNFLPAAKVVQPAWLQHEFRIENADGRFLFLGYKDLRLPRSEILPALKLLPNAATTPCVVDFKTTKHFRYRKTAEILKTDVQANLYAFDEFIQNPELDFVDLYWLSMCTKEGEAEADFAHYRAHKDDVAAETAKIEETAERLYQIRVKAPSLETDPEGARAYVMSLMPNGNACDAYGGCPHRKTCNLAPKQHRESAIERLRKEKGEGYKMASALDALRRLKDRKPVEAPAPNLMGCADTEVPPPPPGFEPFAGINPPEKDLPFPGPTDTTPPVAEVAPMPKKRGRPAGSKNKPKEEAEPPPVVEAVPVTPAEIVPPDAPGPIVALPGFEPAFAGLIQAAANLGDAIREAAKHLGRAG